MGDPMKRWMLSCVVGLFLCGASIEAGAVSIGVDFDLGTAGFQSQGTVALGEIGRASL